MGILIERQNSFLYAASARLVDESREMAWAERSVRHDPAKKWVLGRYVEADRANLNRQYWKLADLRAAHDTIKNSPLNLNHRHRMVVGHYVDTELMYPMTDAEAATEQELPYIEALAAFYSYYFPEEYKLVEMAHASGNLYFSMECISKSITCIGDEGCNVEYEYAGVKSDTYCEHLNTGASIKQLNDPHFLGGALIVPPEKPGWTGAEIRDLSVLVKENLELAEVVYEGAKAETPHLDSKDWEQMMLILMDQANRYRSTV